jgi:hypothetical protein
MGTALPLDLHALDMFCTCQLSGGLPDSISAAVRHVHDMDSSWSRHQRSPGEIKPMVQILLEKACIWVTKRVSGSKICPCHRVYPVGNKQGQLCGQ